MLALTIDLVAVALYALLWIISFPWLTWSLLCMLVLLGSIPGEVGILYRRKPDVMLSIDVEKTGSAVHRYPQPGLDIV